MATIPRFDIPSQMNKPGPWVIQPISPSSDGDPSKWGAPPYRIISNDSYRVKIGSMWAEQKGIATPGKLATPEALLRVLPLLLWAMFILGIRPRDLFGRS